MNSKRKSSENEMHPLIDREKQKKAKDYEGKNRKVGIYSFLVNMAFLLVFYYSGFSEKLANLKIGGSLYLIFIIYIFVFLLLKDIISLPFSYISGYELEHEYGFSRQNKKEWFVDHLKSFLLSILLGFVVFAVLLFLLEKFPGLWWLYSGGFMAFFSVILATIFPVLIMPIYHDYTRIEDEDLKDSLSEVMDRAGIKIEGFYREDTSSKTTKENAMLAGLSRTKRVILADNIIEEMNSEEIKTVLAHEVGHYFRGHLLKMIAIGTLLQIGIFFFLDRLIVSLFPSFLSSFPSNMALIPMLLFFLNIFDITILKVLQNWISRFFEKEADREALELTRSPQDFKRAMAGLANRNLSNAYPRLWVKLLYYDHPPVGERIRLAERWENGD